MSYQRYQRHYSVIGLDGQEKLNKASILIIGCGGIGSPVSLYLAAAGIGKLGLVDNDNVELSNLQRQILFATKDIGQSKAEIAKQKVGDLNPEIEIVAYNTRLDEENIFEIIQDYALVIDGSDNYKTRYLVNDACAVLSKPFISASVLMGQGQIAYFNIVDGCYRCLYPSPPPEVLSPNCAEAGVIGVVVGVVGMLAANMAVNSLLKKIENQLIFYDGNQLQSKKLTVVKNQACQACAEKTFVPLAIDAVDLALQYCVDIAQIELNDYRILDVREPWEHQLVHIPNDVNIRLRDIYLTNQLPEKSGKPLLVYCKAGVRGAKAVKHLLSLGYSDVFNLNGGIMAYLKNKGDTICY